MAAARSQVGSPAPDDAQVNGNRVASPAPDGRVSRQDRKRLSLAFLTKEFLMGEPEKDKEARVETQTTTDEEESGTASTRSHSKEASRHRLSLSFLNPAPMPSSPQPEALPSYPTPASDIDGAANQSQSSLQRTPSHKRPETIKSMKSDKSLSSSRTESVKKRLSFMHISKKGSKSSVRGRVDNTLVEE